MVDGPSPGVLVQGSKA